jgi:UDP-3-O-[3-hydroxymyristoyl] glucosamine N-acyltransferase
MSYTLTQIAEKFGGTVMGNGDCVIDSVAPVQDSHATAISFVSSSRFAQYLEETAAAAVIVTEELVKDLKTPALIVKNPRATYARITAMLYPATKSEPGIHATAVIDESAEIDASAYIGANCVINARVKIFSGVSIESGSVIGRDSVIGQNTYLHANVTVYDHCVLGKGCIIHSSTVIGADGFGFEQDEGEWVKIPQIGGVRIGNDVEIGACSTVDRGAMYDTIIEDGVKLDNHIQIAHNVKVGAHTVMSNGVGVAGSTVIGKNCLIGGMTGIKDNIEITDNVIITAMSLVSKSLTKAGSYSSNTPIDDTRTWRKNSARFRQLDELARRIKQLEKQLANK